MPAKIQSKRITSIKMALVIGDHQSVIPIEIFTVLKTQLKTSEILSSEQINIVVLIDLIPQGGTLIITTFPKISVDDINIELKPSEGPISYKLQILKQYNLLRLQLPNGTEKIARIDHRDPLGTILIYSCDHIEADIYNSLFNQLRNEYDRSINDKGRLLHLHIGDNTYNDHAWHESTDETALENYRHRYRKTWFSTPERRETYASGSHLMIEDDHFIVNDYIISDNVGTVISDRAYRCYEEYQESLHLTLTPTLNRGWIRNYGDDVVMTFERFSNPVNVEYVISAIKSGLEGLSPKGLIIATGWPCIPAPRVGISGRLYRGLTGCRKFLTDDDLISLYEALAELPVENILLVGGDLHFGYEGIIETVNKRIKLVIASPISNHPDLTRIFASNGYPRQFDLSPQIQIHTIHAQADRNYLRVTVREEGARYLTTMIYADQYIPNSTIRYINSLKRMLG